MPRGLPPSDNIIILEPFSNLRKIVGSDADLSAIFSPERIAACQQLVDKAREGFFDTVAHELANLEALIDGRTEVVPTEASFFEKVTFYVTNIKGYAELFQYKLIIAICAHILRHCRHGTRPAQMRSMLIIDLSHILSLSINRKITEQDGEIQKKLTEILQGI